MCAKRIVARWDGIFT